MGEAEKGDSEKGSSRDEHKDQVQLPSGDVIHVSDFVPPTPEEEAAVIRKLDFRLIPIVFILYMLSVLDRANLGNAKLAGLEDDINLEGFRYNWLGTIFYISYILSQWTLMGWKHFPPHIWATAVVFAWGLIATLQAACTSWSGLMATRFFLGVTEAAFGPGVPLYLSFFYPREKVGFRDGIFISASAIANCYGGALAYGVGQITNSIAPWRILFIVEGIPTCLLAALPYFFLPDSIADAKFFSEREKQISYHMVARNQRLDIDRKRGLRFKEMFDGLWDPKSFLPGIMYFSCNVSFASLPLFLPTIIEEMGEWDDIHSNGLSAPPYLGTFFFIIIMCWLSDHFKLRGPFVALTGIISGIGFIVNASTTSPGSRYFSCFLCPWIFAAIALLLAWVSNIHATESRRAGGYTVLATLGQCGPVLGTNIYPDSDAPRFQKGLYIAGSFCFLVTIVSTCLSLWLHYENKKLDRQGIHDLEEFEDTNVGQDRAAQKRHRYVL